MCIKTRSNGLANTFGPFSYSHLSLNLWFLSLSHSSLLLTTHFKFIIFVSHLAFLGNEHGVSGSNLDCKIVLDRQWVRLEQRDHQWVRRSSSTNMDSTLFQSIFSDSMPLKLKNWFTKLSKLCSDPRSE